jgi:hypothetical protein
MAEIVKACDTSLPSRPLVAVKRILPHLCDDTQYRTMFMDESRVLAQLDHPNIIHAFEIGEVEGTPYIALDYVDGQDARSLFHRTRGDGNKTERVPIAIACHIIACVCDGLHHAHEQQDAEGELLGLVHRDVSLQNVLLSYAGDVKITDFGIAVSSQNEARTEVGIVKGKFGYMSPEQIRGAPLDRRSDVFGAGICLYELTTGERLFVGDNDYKAIERVRNVEIDPPSKLNRNIPSELERIIMKALAKALRDRYSSAFEMRRDLLAFMAAAGERCTREDLGTYLRGVFPEEYESPDEGKTQVGSNVELDEARAALPRVEPVAIPAAAAAPGTMLDGTTGLAAFDHLDPVSTVSFAADPDVTQFTRLPAAATPSLRSVRTPAPAPSAPRASRPSTDPAFRPAPVVPPVVPAPDSIPGTVQAEDLLGADVPGIPEPRPLSMEWDEHEPTTVSRGFDALPAPPSDEPEPLMPEDEVTRVRTDEPLPNLEALFARDSLPVVPQPKLPDWEDTPPITRTTERLRLPAFSFAQLDPNTLVKVVGGVASLLVVLAAALYWTRDRGAATIHLTTEPRDAVVSVDGTRVAATASPFVLSDLDTTEEHTITVDKHGFQGWSTRLKLRPDQVLNLPLIRLEPDQPQPSGARSAGSPDAASPAAARTAEPSEPPAVQERPSAPAAESGKPTKRVKREVKAAEPAEPRAAKPIEPRPAKRAPATAAAGSGEMGTLRINSRPWSRVSIDGKVIGNTPLMAIPLRAGKHTVQLTNPEFRIHKTVTVEIKAGEVVTRVINLQ